MFSYGVRIVGVLMTRQDRTTRQKEMFIGAMI